MTYFFENRMIKIIIYIKNLSKILLNLFLKKIIYNINIFLYKYRQVTYHKKHMELSSITYMHSTYKLRSKTISLAG